MAKISATRANAYRMELTAAFGLAIFAIGLLAQLLRLVADFGLANAGKPINLFDTTTYSWVIIGWSATCFAAIGPPLVAYFAGERLAKPRTKYEHYYNGVLFAFLAIWLSAAVGGVMYAFTPVVVAMSLPVDYSQWAPQVSALLIVLLLAFLYGKKYKKVPLHSFKPYQVLLIGCIVTLFTLGALSLVAVDGQALELVAISVIGTLISVGMIAIPYIFSTEPDPVTRFTHACVAGSIGIWSLVAIGTLPAYVYSDALYSAQAIATPVIGLAAWLVYIYLLHRHDA